MTSCVYERPEYRRSRGAYRLFCMLEYFIALLVSDVYLFKLLTYVGLSDGSIGIVSSLITVACLFQLSSIGLVRHIRNVKKWAVTFCLASQTVFVLLYLLPFLPLSLPSKTAFAFGGILLGYFFNYAIASILFQWANSYVDPYRRAVFSADKERMSLLGGMLFTLVLGVVVDRFELADRLPGAFALIIAAGLLINAVSLAALLCIDGRWNLGAQPEGIPLLHMARALLRNRGFIRVVVLSALWSCAQYVTLGFLGSYKSRELMLSVGTVQLINILGNACRFLLSRTLGRYADRTSYAQCIEVALYIAAAAFLCVVLTAPSSRWFIVAFTLLIAVSQAGVAQNLLNIVYDYVPAAYFVQASSIRSCVGGLCGFGAALMGGWLLGFVQRRGGRLLGVPLYGQQALAFLSFVLSVAAALYVRFTLRRRPPGGTAAAHCGALRR